MLNIQVDKHALFNIQVDKHALLNIQVDKHALLNIQVDKHALLNIQVDNHDLLNIQVDTYVVRCEQIHIFPFTSRQKYHGCSLGAHASSSTHLNTQNEDDFQLNRCDIFERCYIMYLSKFKITNSIEYMVVQSAPDKYNFMTS